ncbi:MAG: hypothetical protein L0Y50_12475 [Beijerinckiaceae bacterium]|nr:hypothetical protein [Beijerinckiaceae bacterium]
MPPSLVPALTPRGVLRLDQADGDFPLDDALAGRLDKYFARGCGCGLLEFGLREAGSSLPPALAFWRDFAMRFVTALCSREEAAQAGEPPDVPAPPANELARLAGEAPPMQGGEYLCIGVFTGLWRDMERALHAELADAGCSIEEFLKGRDSRWRLVGRVHFNLAENRKDPECPFAFVAMSR